MPSLIFCSDHRYAIGVAVTGRMALEHSSEPCAMHVLHDGIPKSEQARIAQSWQHPNCRSVEFIDFDTSMISGFRPTMYIKSLITYAKMFIGSAVKHDGRLTFLDPDLLVYGDVTELENSDLEGNIMGAVQDISVRADGQAMADKFAARLGIKDGFKYLNSGVLVLDLQRWRDEKIEQQCFDLALNAPEKLDSMDQDALNIVLEDRWKMLDVRWNTSQYEAPPGTRSGIVHLIGQAKPWHDDYNYHFKDAWFEWVDRTAYRGFRTADPNGLGARWSRLRRQIPTPGIVASKIKRMLASPR